MTSRTRHGGWSALLLLAALPGSASAQAIPLEQAETVVATRLQQVLENAPADRPVPWRDEASGLSGTIVAAPATFSGRPCRALRYTVQGGSELLSVEGERCREPGGQWVAGRFADRIAETPAANPMIRDLQGALRRLAYYRGAVDGVASSTLTRALLAFEHDEQVLPDAEPSPDLLGLADAAIARIPAAGSCTPEQPVPDGWSAACGSTR